MEMSVREARAGFAAAIAAAERGERVTITKNGRPVAELGPPLPKAKPKWSWAAFDEVQERLGLAPADSAQAPGPVDVDWTADHAWSREVLGLAEDEPLQR